MTACVHAGDHCHPDYPDPAKHLETSLLTGTQWLAMRRSSCAHDLHVEVPPAVEGLDVVCMGICICQACTLI